VIASLPGQSHDDKSSWNWKQLRERVEQSSKHRRLHTTSPQFFPKPRRACNKTGKNILSNIMRIVRCIKLDLQPIWCVNFKIDISDWLSQKTCDSRLAFCVLCRSGFIMQLGIMITKFGLVLGVVFLSLCESAVFSVTLLIRYWWQ